MQASNRRQAALSESQRGCGRHLRFYKILGEFVPVPSLPPLGEVPRSGKGGVVGIFELLPFNEPHPLSQPLRAASSPIGEPRKPLRIRLGFSELYSAYRKPLRHAYARPSSPFRGGPQEKKPRRFARNRRSRISAGMWADLAQGPGRGVASFKQVSWLMHHRTTRRLLGSLQWPGPCPLARRLRTDSGGTAPDSHRVPYSPPHPGRHLNALATPHNLAKSPSLDFWLNSKFGKRRNTVCTRKGYAASVSQLTLATAAQYFSFFKLMKWGKKTAAARRHNCAVLPSFCCYDTAIHRICQAD